MGARGGPGPPTLKIFLKKKKILNFVFYFNPPKLFSFQFGPPIFIRLGPPLVVILLYVTFFFFSLFLEWYTDMTKMNM